MKLILGIILVIILGGITSASTVTALNNPISIGSWIGNQTIKYTYLQCSSGLDSNCTNGNFNGYTNFTSNQTGYFTLTETYPQYYYQSQYGVNNSNVGTGFHLGAIAYPQGYLNSMIESNFSGCGEKNFSFSAPSGNITYSFFNDLCAIYKYPASLFNTSILSNQSYNSSEKNQAIKGLVASTVPNDIFTKLFYENYANASAVCTNPSNINRSSNYVVYSYCNGNSSDYAIPYYQDYVKYITSLENYLSTLYFVDPNILYDQIAYSIKNQNIFPIQNNPQLVQTTGVLAGVYPGMIPSGSDAIKMLNNSTIGIPINYFNSSKLSELNKNGINIISGIYNNISIDYVLQNKINDYSYYNLSTNQYPFYGSYSSGPTQYYDSCGSSPGLSQIESKEVNNMMSQFYSTMTQSKLYPSNYYQNINGSEYGPSIIAATPSNIIINNNKITYGALYYGNKNAYKNSTSVSPAYNQTALSFNIPVSAIKHPAQLHQIYVNISNNYSYTMTYYGFNTEFSQPKYTITNGQYQNTKTETIDNKTVVVTQTCHTSAVQSNINYTSTKYKIGNKNYNYNNSQNSYINVSTNLNITGFLNNGALNYTYDLYQSSIPSKKSYSNVTIPSGTEFKLFSGNNSLVGSFTASYLINSTIYGNAANSALFIYAPTYIYPNIYPDLTFYYPTILSYSDNQQFNNMKNTYQIGVSKKLFSGSNNEVLNFISNIFNGAGSFFDFIISNSSIKTYITDTNKNIINYYNNGCPNSKLGNYCVIYSQYYTIDNSSPDYNLFNPILYTQNLNSYGSKPVSVECLEYGILAKVSCNSDNVDGVTRLLTITSQLNFNETWKGFNTSQKMAFYNYLKNTSIYNETFYGNASVSEKSCSLSNTNGVSSVVCNPTNTNVPTQGLWSILFPQSIGNMTFNGSKANLNLSGSYSYLGLLSCKYDLCFSTTIYPTKVYTELYYTYEFIENGTYKVSIYPNNFDSEEYPLNSSITATANVSFFEPYTISSSKSGGRVSGLIGPTFYIKRLNANNSSITFSNNTFIIKGQSFIPYNITINIVPGISDSIENPLKTSDGKYSFVIPSQTIKINSNFVKENSAVYWLTILVILLILFVLWKKGFFNFIGNDYKIFKSKYFKGLSE